MDYEQPPVWHRVGCNDSATAPVPGATVTVLGPGGGRRLVELGPGGQLFVDDRGLAHPLPRPATDHAPCRLARFLGARAPIDGVAPLEAAQSDFHLIPPSRRWRLPTPDSGKDGAAAV